MSNVIQDDLVQILEEMSIKASDFKPSTNLGEGIGMDSQEIIEFVCAIESKYQIFIPVGTFQKKTLLSDVIQRISLSYEGKNSRLLDGFSNACQREIFIDASVQSAFDGIYFFEKWPELLPHVKEIKTLYNDGKFQEFLMKVDSGNGVVDVRSVRRCNKEGQTIRFFQPQPPPYLQHHCGGWFFEGLSPGSCRVTTWHQWNIADEKAQEKFQTNDPNKYGSEIADILINHAELALTTWKKNLEN